MPALAKGTPTRKTVSRECAFMYALQHKQTLTVQQLHLIITLYNRNQYGHREISRTTFARNYNNFAFYMEA